MLVNIAWYNRLPNRQRVSDFIIRLIPTAILANWFDYHRNILATILLHSLLVITTRLVQINPQTKFIITTLLLLIRVVLIYLAHQFFSAKHVFHHIRQ